MFLTLKEDIHNITGDELQLIIDSLPEWRRQQALKFKFEQGRRECALSYMMLTDCLRKEYGITEPQEFVIGKHGKPSLKDHPEIHFNISHCKNAIAVAVDDNPVGIDVERIGRFSESVARYSMNDEEIDSILTNDNKELIFTRLWTKKEAVLKLTGEGINDDVKSVLTDIQNIKIETYDHPERGYVLSLAYSI